MIKKVLLVTLAFFTGIFIYMHTHGISIITQITNIPNVLTNVFQPIITPIQHMWTSMPDSVRGITIAGIPTLFMVFFAWSKNRAMQKLEQTKVEAEQKITQITSEASEVKAQVKGYEEMQKQYRSNFAKNIENLTTRATNAEATVKTQTQELAQWIEKQKHWDQTKHRFEEERRQQKSKIKSLQYELDVERGLIKPPVK